MTTRETLLASWHASQRQAERTGAILLNPASFAGYCLEQSGGPVHHARGLVPAAGDSVFYARVRSILDAVEVEERSGEAVAC